METAIVLEEVGASGGGLNGAMLIQGAMFIPRAIINYSTEEKKSEYLPLLSTGEKPLQYLALTEPYDGFDSTAISTRADRQYNVYVVNEQKTWTSRLYPSNYMVLIARTPQSEVERNSDGINLFLVDIEDAKAQGTIDAER